MAGLFITLEGCDGIGKGRQAELLVAELRDRGHDVYATKEPGNGMAGSVLGPLVRSLVFGAESKDVRYPQGGPQLFLLADHIDNVARFVPELRSGKTVVCDRYADSAWAYAPVHQTPTPSSILNLWEMYRGPLPDITILLIARGKVITNEGNGTIEDIRWVVDRARNRRGEEEGKQRGKAWDGVEALNQVQRNYLCHLLNETRTVIVPVYEQDSVDEVHVRIMTLLDKRLAEKRDPTRLLNLIYRIRQAPISYLRGQGSQPQGATA
jgi:thymidylate kinase